MSRESALAAVTGTPVTPSAPVAPEVPPSPDAVAPEAQTANPGLASTPFSALAKKEAELVRKQQEFKKEQEQVAAEKEKIASIQKQIQTYEEMKKTDPVAALKMLGFTETDIFNYMAANEKKEPSPQELAAQAASEAAEARIKAFEEAQAKKIADEQKAKDDAVIAGFKSDLSKAIKADPDAFEYCNYYGEDAQVLMYETAIAVLKESNGTDVLTPLEAAQMVEAYYEEQDKLMNSLKKRNIKPPTPEAPKTEETTPTRTRTVSPSVDPALTPKPTITRTRTLTSAATSTVASTRQTRNETREEKRERLMAALRGN